MLKKQIFTHDIIIYCFSVIVIYLVAAVDDVTAAVV